MQSRTLVARILLDVLNAGMTLEQSLARHTPTLPRREQAFVQELCYGVLRWLPQLRFQLGQLLRKPLKPADADVELLLLSGLYQILSLRTPDHAAVSATVDSCRELGKPWASKLINALLRRALREREPLSDSINGNPAASHAHPAWLLRRLQHDWPDHWQAIATANNARPPLYIRVNARRIQRDDYIEQLHEAGLEGQPHPHALEALRVTPAVGTEGLPGFAGGLASVQDPAAQLAPALLDLQPGLRILDACAAPGGKTAHLLEREPSLAEVVAVELSPERLQRLQDGLARLQLSATCIAGDATRPDSWWDGRPFDRILLDAPCSGTGVIRRHPDIKYHRDTAAISTAARLQSELLQRLWPLLAPGGKLLYATCSILPCENSEQINDFLASQTDASEQPVTADWGRPLAHGRQILPGDNDMDGFFYACLTRAR